MSKIHVLYGISFLFFDCQFIEGTSKDQDSGDEEETDDDSGADEAIADNQKINECNDTDIRNFDSLCLIEQVLFIAY